MDNIIGAIIAPEIIITIIHADRESICSEIVCNRMKDMITIEFFL